MPATAVVPRLAGVAVEKGIMYVIGPRETSPDVPELPAAATFSGEASESVTPTSRQRYIQPRCRRHYAKGTLQR